MRIPVLLLSCLFLLPVARAADGDGGLGSIHFPNSGDPAAQAAFLTGVKALHSFQFDEAQLAFREAQALDPDFALAYWGEAMSVNKPLWRIQDTGGARAILKRLAPDLAGRQAKAGSDKERAWLAAVDALFYGPEDKLERDHNYRRAMQQMQERWPDDHEIAVFHALSILGTRRPGDSGFRPLAEAAAISLAVFDENPEHPGAAHFVIHSFDDPEHAILALPAARVYADIAPAAAHALHMPSHIFLQLGHWQRVVDSNTEAYAAAVAINERLNLPEGREDFHTLSWLAYGNLMLGNVAAAEANLADARAALDRNPDNARVEDGWLTMRARHLLETGAEGAPPLPPADSSAGRHAHWIGTVGLLAARERNAERARAAQARLASLGEAAQAAGDAWQASLLEVLHHQIEASLALANGNGSTALEAAQKAVDIDRQLGAPSGPPVPLKPARELYGEILLEIGRHDAAMTAFADALDWIPGRTPSLLGLARAAAFAGEADVALSNYRTIVDMPGLNGDSAAMKEAATRLD